MDLPLLDFFWWVRSQPGGPGCLGGGEVAGLVFVGSSCGNEQFADEELRAAHRWDDSGRRMVSSLCLPPLCMRSETRKKA